MIKSFEELQALDLSKQVSKKPTFTRDKTTGKLKKTGELDYLNWADCLSLLHGNGAQDVKFGNVCSGKDHPVFLLNERLPFVRVFVEVDGERRELDYPVIDGSRDVDMEHLAQSDVHNATQRGFVKCVAINWGLGLSLWRKEDADADKSRTQQDLLESSSIYAIKERVERLITARLQGGMSMEDIYSMLGIRKSSFDKLMGYFDQINTLEQRLRSL